MNWNDYTRGYDEGQSDYFPKKKGNLLTGLLKLACAVLYLLLAIVYGVLGMLLRLLKWIVKA